MHEQPLLLLTDPDGHIFEYPSIRCVGKSGRHFTEVNEWIPLPVASKLFTLPGRRALGWDSEKKELQPISEIWEGNRNFAPTPVAAFLPPGYVRTHLPAAEVLPDAPILPTWAYTCVAWHKGQFYTAAYRIDTNEKWQPDQYDDRALLPCIQEFLEQFPENRLVKHLANCATHYHCFAAKNLFLNRWEAPLPVAHDCNAGCLGCLSWQPKNHHPSSHNRIQFRPTVEEICQIAVQHLENAPEAMVSFGQGCEGEPLLEHELIGEAITAIRTETKCGTIHLNTNGSRPRELEQIIARGLDSVRISTNSFLSERYNAYFSPRNYSFSDVKKSAMLVREAGVYLHLNLLVFPGLSDQQQEIDMTLEWIQSIGIDRIQLKNLCIDSDMYINSMPGLEEKGKGMQYLRDAIYKYAPQVALGYFNIPKEEFNVSRRTRTRKVVNRMGETP